MHGIYFPYIVPHPHDAHRKYVTSTVQTFSSKFPYIIWGIIQLPNAKVFGDYLYYGRQKAITHQLERCFSRGFNGRYHSQAPHQSFHCPFYRS